MKSEKFTFTLFAAIIMVIFSYSIDLFASEKIASTSQKKIPEEQLWDIYYDFLSKIKPYGIPLDRQKHEKEIGPTLTHIKKTHIRTMTESYALIYKPRRINVEIDEYTGEIRNYMLTPVNYYENSDKNEKFTTKMKKEEAIEKAESYLYLNTVIKTEEFLINVGPSGDEWHIDFHRKQGNYEFMKDRIIIVFSEKYGLLYYQNNFFSDECDINLKIDETKANELTEKYFSDINGKSLLKKIFVKYSRIVIVNPALLKLDYETNKLPMDEMRKSRLVWETGYSGSSNKNQPIAVAFYIDAINGELIHYIIEPLLISK